MHEASYCSGDAHTSKCYHHKQRSTYHLVPFNLHHSIRVVGVNWPGSSRVHGRDLIHDPLHLASGIQVVLHHVRVSEHNLLRSILSVFKVNCCCKKSWPNAWEDSIWC